ncbi:MAG TPA: hypothetical protein PKX17_03455 [Candidatus Methanomethylicus sp.]|nr:hypothetical protein [Candidatus Methanomethylicus sp.]
MQYNRVCTLDLDDPLEARDSLELALKKYGSVKVVWRGGRKAVVNYEKPSMRRKIKTLKRMLGLL